MISSEREKLFKQTEKDLLYEAKVYLLGDHFENLPPNLSSITILDVTDIPGCHYGLRNVFVPIIHHLETNGLDGLESDVVVSPKTVILVEPSTGNGWVAFSDAAEKLDYEHIVVMPDGLPEARYRHRGGRKVQILRTPAAEYALGMPKQLQALIAENKQRLSEGKKMYVSPNHPVGAASITVEAMSELGRQLVDHVRDRRMPIRTVISMGNGASLCALGEYVKSDSELNKVVATESLAFGGGYDQFAVLKGLPRYKDLFGIDPGNDDLMSVFSTYGTNAPIGIELPLQTRAIKGLLIDDYVLFTDQAVLEKYRGLNPQVNFLRNAEGLINYSNLPLCLFGKYGNSTLANIAVAAMFNDKNEIVVAMAYDGRANY